MMVRQLLLLLALLPLSAQAQAVDRREPLRAAFDAAEAGRLDLLQAQEFAREPAYPWLQATILRKQIAQASGAQVQPVLASLGDSPAGRWLRPAWLAELAKRKDWPAFRQAYQASEDTALRCAELQARAETGAAAEPAWSTEARQLYLSGKSLPNACDPVLSRLGQIGRIDDVLRWQRIDLAIAAGEAGVIRSVAKGLAPPADQLAAAYAGFIAAPTAMPAGWPADARTRSVIETGLVREARRSPDRARELLAGLPAGALEAEQRGRVAYQIALWTVASYLPGSAERLNAVPASAYDERLHEWRAREAISRRDDPAALRAIEQMGATQRGDSRWQYFEARLRERLGQGDAARGLYERAAQSPGFHGWLAADRLQKPYTLCALEPVAGGAVSQRVAGNAGLVRALDLFALDREGLAAREWAATVKAMSHDERRVAVQRAIAVGWFDRAVFGMGAVPEDQQHYSLRFPLHHAEDIREQSRHNALDPAWVAGQTRAESSFMPRARSGADARGLMQILPGTGQLTAKRLGIHWGGAHSLYEPTTNIRLGTAYLRQMLDRFGGLPYLAIAAYNAGPSPVDRWRGARADLDPDFFIESIPYKETREYVARVLAFSVVYDWRLDGSAAPLSQRMLGRVISDPGQRRPFACAASTKLATP